jgi:hypothetical protein
VADPLAVVAKAAATGKIADLFVDSGTAAEA